MKNNLILTTIVLSTGCLVLITAADLSPNNTLGMFLSTTIQSSTINTSSPVHNLSISGDSYAYNMFKDGSNLTRPQIKVVLTVVILISLIMFIVAIFRFKNACREQERQTIQTELVPHRTSQFCEPSSRRESVGYYTPKYTQPPGGPFDEQFISNSEKKRYSVPVCDLPSKSVPTTTVLSVTPKRLSTIVTTTTDHRQYVTPSDGSLNSANNQHVPVAVKPIVRKSCSAIGISRSRRLILCTVPPDILCRPNTVRYSLVLNVHDHRHRRHSTSNSYFKVSSPTLRKLCLPCITSRNHQQHNNHQQQSKKNKSTKTLPRQNITNPVAENSNVIESTHRVEVAPRIHDPRSTTLVVHSSDSLREDDAHEFSEQPQQHVETSLQNGQIDEKDDKVSVKAEISSTKLVAESVLPTLSSSSGNIIKRSNEDDVCDDQTPLLTSELVTTIKNSSNRTTRKYSLNAFVPLLRSSKPHPLASLSTTTVAAAVAAVSNNSVGDENKSRPSVDIKSRRRVSLSSALRRNSFAKHSQASLSTNIEPAASLPPTNIDSESSDQTSLLESKPSTFKNPLRKKAASITPIISTTTKAHRKDFMQKIERFRFIDDSASSTTTVTSPVESIDRINGHQPCSHLITSAIEQFDDYVRSRYHQTDEINCYIDRLNSDVLTNGSYSDLNILNSTHDNLPIQQQKPVKKISSQSQGNDYHPTIRNSAPMTIPSSQHARHAYPSDNSISRPTTIVTNGHSRSMDFHSINNLSNKSELHRPMTLSNTGNIYETSSSSLATLTSVRSSTSLEFHDDTKPSGVLVDDDFLPMSSPVDEHFWDVTMPVNHHRYSSKKNECFPNVGSSPDVEVKPFDTQETHPFTSSIEQPFSETSCDEDDDEISSNAQKFSIHEYKLKALQKPIVIHRAILNPSIQTTPKPSHDESLLEKFASANAESVQIPIRSPPLRTSTTGDTILTSQTIYEEDDTQESSTNDNGSDESADNGEIDLVHEFELSQRQEQNQSSSSALWSTNDRDIFILQEDDFLSALVTTPTQTQQINRPAPPSIMKIAQNKSLDSIDEQSPTTTTTAPPSSLKPKVRFNLDPQYEREREWNKVNKLLGNSVEWTDEFEV